MSQEKRDALTKEYNCLCLKVRSTCTAPVVGCALKGRAQDGASIQLLSHYDQATKHKEKKIWSLHGATFRCVFGTNCKVTFDKSTGERIENIPVDIDKRTHAALDHILDLHIYACPPQHNLEQCFVDVADLSLEIERKGTVLYRPGDDLSVQRMHLAELRITVFHANSAAWQHAHLETCHHIGKLIYASCWLANRVL